MFSCFNRFFLVDSCNAPAFFCAVSVKLHLTNTTNKRTYGTCQLCPVCLYLLGYATVLVSVQFCSGRSHP